MLKKVLVQDPSCPFQLSVTDEAQPEIRFQSELQILYLLSGEMTCTLEGRSYRLGQWDFIFINTYEIYSISTVSPDCRYLRLKVEENRLRPLFSTKQPMLFQWEESLNNRERELYRRVAAGICDMAVDAVNRPQGYLASIYRSGLDVLACLEQQCRQYAVTEGEERQSAAFRQKAREIMDFLNEHYTEPISLNDAAKLVYLSPPYVSRIFKDAFRIGFLEYLNYLRIRKSLPMLESDRHIIDIAIECGFSNAKTYSRVFQGEMGITPTEYRKQKRETIYRKNDLPEWQSEKKEQILTLVGQAQSALQEGGDTEQYPIRYDFSQPSEPQEERPWYKVLNVGMASLVLHRHIQDDILRAEKELRVEDVRLTGVLSDILQIYQEDEFGNVSYFWDMLDEVLDFLQDNKIRPFLCLGYMPEKLAARKVVSPYIWSANTSKPASMTKWCAYLRAFLSHLVRRYTYEEVCRWKFEFWNSPQLQGSFWHDSREEFYEFFFQSYMVFRQVLPDGCFGSSGIIYIDQYKAVREFLQWCKERGVRFDIYCLHSYELNDPGNRENQSLNEQYAKRSLAENGRDYLLKSIHAFQEIVEELDYKAPIYITEWNISPYFHDLTRDTCFMSTYIADMINHLPSSVASISYWALSDATGEHTPNQTPFAGELGMLTRTGLAKPAYLVFLLLVLIRGKVLESGENYMITQSSYGWHILMYNATYYTEDFLQSSRRLQSGTDRYQVFKEKKTLRFNLHLTVPEGYYRLENHFLNREEGSVYDAWAAMGGPRYMDHTTHRLLRRLAAPKIQVQYKVLSGNVLFSEEVPLHGLQILSLVRIEDPADGWREG
ncbi:MAG: helix-turn-helix domain-containing protein [Eubacteriales bacterium]|nr:helix-turn-helix domain-containing protein [Eubacteriales bacterium]